MSHPDADPAGGTDGIVLRYWASLRAAAGVDFDHLPVREPVRLAELKSEARRRHPSGRFGDVLSTCSVLVDDRPASTGVSAEVLVSPGQVVEFLPPFAGG